jgi:hypothetical protein
VTERAEPAEVDDDPFRTATYMRGLRNGMTLAADQLHMSAQTIRLHAGEMSAQEMRTVQAVLRWKIAEINQMAQDEWRRIMGDKA